MIHEGGVFPAFVVSDTTVLRVFVKIKSVTDFIAAWMISNDYIIEGEPFSAVRRAPVFHGDGADLWVIERHGSRSAIVPPPDPQRSIRMVRHLESLRRRERDWPDDDQGFARVPVQFLGHGRGDGDHFLTAGARLHAHRILDEQGAVGQFAGNPQRVGFVSAASAPGGAAFQCASGRSAVMTTAHRPSAWRSRHR